MRARRRLTRAILYLAVAIASAGVHVGALLEDARIEVTAAPPEQGQNDFAPPADYHESAQNGRPATSISQKKSWLREEYFLYQRAFPGAETPPAALLQARQELDARLRAGTLHRAPQLSPAEAVGQLLIPRVTLFPAQAQATSSVTDSAWTSIGPRPIAANGPSVFGQFGIGPPPNSGRVSAIAVVDANTAYIGSASGGVWRTTNAGANWTPLGDTQSSLSIGAIALDRDGAGVFNNVVYAGLGEQNFSGDSYYGFGILKSTDGGTTWTLLNAPVFNRQRMGRIAIDPNSPTTCSGHCTLYAATSNGIARSDDGGGSWLSTDLGGQNTVTDVVIDESTNPSTVYAAAGRIFGSAANGVYQTTTNLAHTSGNWTKRAGATFPATDVGRVRLAITHTGGADTLYAAVHAVSNGAPDGSQTNGLKGVWKTTDGGLNWTQTTHPEASLDPFQGTSSICSQCWYDLNIAVASTDANVVYVLTTEVYRSADGGVNWTLLSNSISGSPNKTHADQHAIDLVPGTSGNSFFLGNDGGVYRSTDGGTTLTNLNADLAVTQFYHGAAHPTDVNQVFGGTQDNGSLSYQNSANWTRGISGDGGFAAIDFSNPNNVYATQQNLSIQRSTSGPTGTFASATSGIGSEARQFIAPFVMDPNTPTTLYAGTTKLYKSTNGAASWTSPQTSPATFPNPVTAIGVAPSATSTLYAGTCPFPGPLPGGAPSGGCTLQVSTDGGATWTNRTAGLPNRFITSIAVDPSAATTAYVTLSGFDTGHVWKTATSGASWTDVSGTLPNAPANTIVLDAANSGVVYVGTDVGVYKSADSAATWQALNTGLPNVVISDLVLHRSGSRLYAFTHGRGVFMADRTVGGPTTTPTPTPTITSTATRTATSTSTATPSRTPTPSNTPLPTSTSTSVASTATSSTTPTPSRTSTPSNTPLPTSTSTSVTSTPTSTATSSTTTTPSSTLTRTGTPTNTLSPTPTSTLPPGPTLTPSATPVASNTPTPTMVPSRTATPTVLGTATPTATATQSATRTATRTATTIRTPTPLGTPAPTNTPRPTSGYVAFGFNTPGDTAGWAVDWGGASQVAQTTTQAFEGPGALTFTAALGGNGADLGVTHYYPTPQDLRGGTSSILSAMVLLPPNAPTGLVGALGVFDPSFTFTASPDVPLVPGTWTPLVWSTAPLGSVSGVTLTISGQASYTGPVFLDQVQVVDPPCAPRPAVVITSTPSSTGTLQATIRAQTNAGTMANALTQLRFGAATNATIDVPGGPSGASGSFNVTLPAGTQQITVAIHRTTAGQGASVPFVVVDSCGDWPTFVGGGPLAF